MPIDSHGRVDIAINKQNAAMCSLLIASFLLISIQITVFVTCLLL
jgi:DNA polymerase sigma